MIRTKDMNLLTGKGGCRRRIMRAKRKLRRQSLHKTTGFGFLRRSSRGSSHVICKAVVLLIVLEGLGCGSGGASIIASAEGTSSTGSGDWQSNQYQQSSFGSSSSGEDSFDDNRGGGGNTGDSFISTLAGNRAEAARRLRDRCGRFSLLKVLQQWENLQRRCRLSVRNILNNNWNNKNNSSSNYQYYEEDPTDRYDWTTPSKSELDMDDNASSDSGNRIIDKRSRHHYYNVMTRPRVNNNDEDSEFINYYYEVNGDALESCCPVDFEQIVPVYGRNRSGHMVELYKDENVQQRFNEYRCRKEYVEKPCRFVEGQFRRMSKCVQQYLDTYALVRSDDSKTGWSMEHIRIASGCACKVDLVAAKRRKKVALAQKNPRRNQQYRPGVDDAPPVSDMYNFGTAAAKRRNSKRRSFQQLVRYPQFSDY